MQILSIKCTHGNEVECPDAPEMDCVLCAEIVAYDIIQIYDDCIFLSKKLYADDEKQWCARWRFYVMDGNRRGAVNCSERMGV